MNLTNESKTLFIPLYGKALMSKQNLFIKDPKAEEIINSTNFNFTNLKQSKWLSMYMATRAKVIDEICNQHIKNNPNTTIIHLGCGLDARVLRVNQNYSKWFDIDFKNVIDIRKQYYQENSKYQMIAQSITNLLWLEEIPNNVENPLIIAEGLTMYLSKEELQKIINGIHHKLGNATLVFDAYSNKAIKASKYKNPINQMKATIKWGMSKIDDFTTLNNHLKFIKQYPIKYKEKNLPPLTKYIFEHLYCGKISSSYYKIYKFKLTK